MGTKQLWSPHPVEDQPAWDRRAKSMDVPPLAFRGIVVVAQEDLLLHCVLAIH
jgi:hypothetical protein